MTASDRINTATHHAIVAANDLEIALQLLACLPVPPEGRSMQHKATAAYIAGCLDAARRLQADLVRISD